MSSMLNDENKESDSIPMMLHTLFNAIDRLAECAELNEKISPVDRDYLLDVKPRMRKYNTDGI